MVENTGRQSEKQARRPKQYEPIVCERCGQLRPHMARGLCKACYDHTPRQYPGHVRRQDAAADLARVGREWGPWYAAEVMPRLERYATKYFRRLPDREAMVLDAVELGWANVVRMAIDGFDPREYVNLVLHNAVKDALRGRSILGRQRGRDVHCERVRYAHGIRLEEHSDFWRLPYRGDAEPADLAALKCDLEQFLLDFSPTERAVLAALIAGYEVKEVCGRFGWYWEKVDQLRRRFTERWSAWQGEDV